MQIQSYFKAVLPLAWCLVASCAYSQITQVFLGINGLTCSQCSRSVEMSLLKLKFVDHVEMELARAEGKVFFKPGQKVDLDRVAQAVYDAGFAVRFIKLEMDLSKNMLSGNCFNYEGNYFQVIGKQNDIYFSNAIFKLLGKNFLPNKEWKEVRSQLVSACTATDQKTYFIQLQ
jgi:copper chaperone CopZ